MESRQNVDMYMSNGNLQEKNRILKKVLWRILPILFIGHFFAFLDRVNIGYAKLQMQDAVGFTDAQYALAAGIFFIGYAIFEIPSNIVMEKIGARRTLARIMILWGAVSAATLFVSTINQLYILRLLLGIFEAGWFPGIMLYLSFWFPSYMRARVISFLLLATLAAPIIGGPISGLIMTHLNNVHGFAGWQWMFMLEALPLIFLGIFCIFRLTDTPTKATWMTESEKKIHKQIMLEDNPNSEEKTSHSSHSISLILKCFLDVRVYLLASLAFAAYCGSYAFNFWLPTMIKDMGITDISHISFYSVIPFFIAGLGMLAVGKSSDKLRERRWHYSLSMLLSGTMFIAAATLNVNFITKLVLLGFAGFGFSGAVVVAWSLPAAYFKKEVAPAGIALVSTLATMSGLFAPWVISYARGTTQDNSSALIVIACIMFLSSFIMAFLVPKSAIRVGGKETKSQVRNDAKTI
ncbi:putative metabolite transport protein NicT [compost metagenome]